MPLIIIVNINDIITIYQGQNSVVDVATCYDSGGSEFESWQTKEISSFPKTFRQSLEQTQPYIQGVQESFAGP
jgi:hypothetical protein